MGEGCAYGARERFEVSRGEKRVSTSPEKNARDDCGVYAYGGEKPVLRPKNRKCGRRCEEFLVRGRQQEKIRVQLIEGSSVLQ